MRCEEEVEHALTIYGDMIRRICFMHVKKEADVEDIFQNVFFKYAIKNTSFTSQEHEKAWLIRITINECNSLLRKWFHKHVELSDDVSQFGILDTSTDTSLLQSVLKLPINYRNVIYLYYYEGYKIQEIAELLHRKENTIHTWMRRAKQALKDELGGEYFEETTS